ncbi:MAG TPA: zinc-binding dehydrogenase [Candidatus Methylomirabilis sp.]|nr:zinc-binding dehydrogenase [Candidatus Methylomirabilis sp.]
MPLTSEGAGAPARSREAWRVRRAGALGRLRRHTESLPEPGPGEARVLVKAIGVNFADVFACLGLYSATPKGDFVPGLEFAGVVEALGPAATPSDAHDALTRPMRTGDRVIGLTRFGAYATAVNLDLRYLRPVPPDWTFSDAAAFPVQGLTAWYGLVEVGGLTPGNTVLVQSAAGGVGLNALAILAGFEARVVATVGRPAKRDFLVECRGLTEGQVIVRDRRRFGAQLDGALASLGLDGFDLVLDAVGGPFFRPAYARIRPAGRYILYGAADFMPKGARPNHVRLALRYVQRPRLDPLQMMVENRSLMAFNLIWLWDQVDRLQRVYDRLGALVSKPPHIGRRFPFDEAPAALRYLQSGESIGKVVIEV